MVERMISSKAKSVILMACGSFNPPTLMHLRLFELAKDHLQDNGINVLGGIISPTHDSYQKEGLIPSNHRVEMIRLSLIDYTFAKQSTWEVEQNQWSRTRLVLDSHQQLLRNFCLGSVEKQSWMPEQVKVVEDPEDIPRIVLVCGADVIETFNRPGLWLEEDVETIVRDYGLAVITRSGSNPNKIIYEHDILNRFKNNIDIVPDRISNGVSSTSVRLGILRGHSVRFMVANGVIDYIYKNKLYSNGSETKTFEYYCMNECPKSVDVVSIETNDIDTQTISIKTETQNTQAVVDSLEITTQTNELMQMHNETQTTNSSFETADVETQTKNTTAETANTKTQTNQVETLENNTQTKTTKTLENKTQTKNAKTTEINTQTKHINTSEIDTQTKWSPKKSDSYSQKDNDTETQEMTTQTKENAEMTTQTLKMTDTANIDTQTFVEQIDSMNETTQIHNLVTITVDSSNMTSPITDTANIETQTKINNIPDLANTTTQTKNTITETANITTQTKNANIDTTNITTQTRIGEQQIKDTTSMTTQTKSSIADTSETTTQTKYVPLLDSTTQTKIAHDCTNESSSDVKIVLDDADVIDDIDFPAPIDEPCSCEDHDSPPEDAEYKMDDIECSYSCSSECSSCSCLDPSHTLESQMSHNLSHLNPQVLLAESIDPDLPSSYSENIEDLPQKTTEQPPATKPLEVGEITEHSPDKEIRPIVETKKRREHVSKKESKEVSSPDVSNKEHKRSESKGRSKQHADKSDKSSAAVQFEITPKGVRVISDKESFL